MDYALLTPFDFSKTPCHLFDLTAQNPDLSKVNLTEVHSFNAYIFDTLKAQNVKIGIGGWLEKRVVYDQLEYFQGEHQRCYHLGVDIWAEAGTPISAIEDCRVHSFKNNDNLGDYGPTIILQSMASNLYFLHGHLNIDSLTNLRPGQLLKKGEQFAKIGPYPENGNWPPHLHFQVMNSMESNEGDFPGVCSANDLEYYKTVCLNPYPFLGLGI
jgi:hypothetical protein